MTIKRADRGYSWTIALITASFVVSGARASVSQAKETLRGPFGVAVRPDGSFCVGEIQGRRVSKFGKDGNYIGAIETVAGYGPLKGVFDVDVGESGNLYIADTLGNAVLVLNPREELILKLGTGGATAEPGGFHEPHFVAPNEKLGLIYVADTHNNRLQVFDMKGKLIKVLGKAGMRGPGEYMFCNGVTFDEQDNLYAFNWTGGYINMYNPKLEHTGTFGRVGKKPGEFNDAYSLVYHDGSFWVADSFSNRLQQFSKDWKVIKVVGGKEGAGDDEMCLPTDLDFDAEGNIYVADWKNERVLKLDPDGKFVREWGGGGPDLAYQPPKVYPRDPSRGPRQIATYSGAYKARADAAKRLGIDRIYVSFANQDGEWGMKNDIDYAHENGVQVVGSIAIFHLGSHNPTWRKRPELYMWKKGASEPDTLGLSYFHPEVRSWKAKHLAEQANKSGIDGILLDYIRYPNALCGYEPAMVEAFRKETGKDANAIPPTDWDWLKFRARYITMFITELRNELAQYGREVEISVYVAADWKEALEQVVHDWREWVYMGIVDRIMIGLYTRDFKGLYEAARLARETCPDRTKVCMMIACQGGNLNTPEMLEKGAEVCFAAGADEVGIYRDDAIVSLDLWDTIGDIATRHKRIRR